jgi:hypothetical protein
MRMLIRKPAAALLIVLLGGHAVLAAAPRPESESYTKLKLLLPKGEKIEEHDVAVLFESSRVVIRSRESGRDLKVFSYANIKSAEYSYSNHPRWKTGAGVAAAVGVFAIPIFFMKGKKHWLSIQAGSDYGVLRLDKSQMKVFIAAFESHTKVKIETVGEEK